MTPILLTITLVLFSNLIALPLGVAWGLAIDALDPAASRGDKTASGCRFGSGGRDGPGQFLRSTFSQVLLASLIAMLALPLYIHASGWEGAAGKFGWLPTIQGGSRFWFQGIWAASWIHGTYGACWIAIATWWALRRRPRAIDQCGRMDVDARGRKWLVDLPAAGGWIIAAVAWNSLLAATEMTVADLYQVSTLADVVYKVYALDPQPVPVLTAVLIPTALVVPVVIFLLSRSRWLTWTLRGGDAFGFNEAEDFVASEKWLAFVVATVITALVGLVPLGSLLAKAGWTVTQVSDSAGQPALTHSFSANQVLETLTTSARSFDTELAWTAQLAFSTILLALPLTLLSAAYSETNHRARLTLLCTMLLLAMIPGPVISLLVIQIFNRPSLGFLYDRTLMPSVVAVLPRALPAGYLILRAGYRMLDRSVLDCAEIDNCGTFRRLWSIDGPRLWRPVLFAAIAIFLIACGDLSATLLVLPPSVSTVASRLFGLLHSGVRHQEAGLALIASFCIGSVSVILIRLVR